jgi:hypothetical protein
MGERLKLVQAVRQGKINQTGIVGLARGVEGFIFSKLLLAMRTRETLTAGTAPVSVAAAWFFHGQAVNLDPSIVTGTHLLFYTMG